MILLFLVAVNKDSDLVVQSIESVDTIDIDNKSPERSRSNEASSDQQNSEVSSTTDIITQNKSETQNRSIESTVEETSSSHSPLPEPSSR